LLAEFYRLGVDQFHLIAFATERDHLGTIVCVVIESQNRRSGASGVGRECQPDRAFQRTANAGIAARYYLKVFGIGPHERGITLGKCYRGLAAVGEFNNKRFAYLSGIAERKAVKVKDWWIGR
jgi:hypothetical protein